MCSDNLVLPTMNDFRSDSSKKSDSRTNRPRTSPQRTSHWKTQKRRKRSTSVSRQSPPTVKRSNSLSHLDRSRTTCSMKSVLTSSCRMPRMRSADPYLQIGESPQLTTDKPLRKSRIIKRDSLSPLREIYYAQLPKQKADESRPASRPPSAMEFQWNARDSIKTSFFTLSSGNDSKSDGKDEGGQKLFNPCGTYKRTSIKKVFPALNASSRGQSPVHHKETPGVQKTLSTSRSPEPQKSSKCTRNLSATKRGSNSPTEEPQMRSPYDIKPQTLRQASGAPGKPRKQPSHHLLNTSTYSGVSHSSRSPMKSWVWFTDESGSPSRNTSSTPSPRANKEKMLEKMLLDAMKYSPNIGKATGQEKSKVKARGSPEKLRAAANDYPREVKVSRPSAQSFQKMPLNDVQIKRENRICDTKNISMEDVSSMLKYRYCMGSPTSNETCLSESRNGSGFSGLDTLSPPSKHSYLSSESTEDSELSTTSVSQESLFIKLQRDMKKTIPHGLESTKNALNATQKMTAPTNALNILRDSPVFVENEQIFQPSVIYAPPMPYTNSSASMSKTCDDSVFSSSVGNSDTNSDETSMSTLTVSCPVFEFNRGEQVPNSPTMILGKPLVKPWTPLSSKRQIFNFKKGIAADSSGNGGQKRTGGNSAFGFGSSMRREPSTQERVTSGVDTISGKLSPKNEGNLTKKTSDINTGYHFRRKYPNLNRNKETLKQETWPESLAIQQGDQAGMKSPVKVQRPSEEKTSPYNRRVRQKCVRGQNQISAMSENVFPSDKTTRPNTPNKKMNTDHQMEEGNQIDQKCASKQVSSNAAKSTTASSICQNPFRKIRNSPIFHHLIRTLVEHFGKIRLPSRHNFHDPSSKPASGRATPTKRRSKKASPPCHDVAVAADLPLGTHPLANAFTNTSDSIEAVTYLGESNMNSQRKIKIRVSVNPSKKKLGNISYRESFVSSYDENRLYLPMVRESPSSISPYTDVTLLEQERNFQSIADTKILTGSPRHCAKRTTGMNGDGINQNLSPELKPVQRQMISNMNSQLTPGDAKELTGFYTFYSENDEESKNKEEKCSAKTRDQEMAGSATSWEDAVEASRKATPNKIATPMRHTVLKKSLERKKSLSRRLHPLLREPNVRTLIRFIPITLLVLSFFYIVRAISNLPHRQP